MIGVMWLRVSGVPQRKARATTHGLPDDEYLRLDVRLNSVFVNAQQSIVGDTPCVALLVTEYTPGRCSMTRWPVLDTPTRRNSIMFAPHATITSSRGLYPAKNEHNDTVRETMFWAGLGAEESKWVCYLVYMQVAREAEDDFTTRGKNESTPSVRSLAWT